MTMKSAYEVEDTQTIWKMIQEFEMRMDHPFKLSTFPPGFVGNIFDMFFSTIHLIYKM